MTITVLTKILSSRDNFLKTCFGMTHAIISLMCCSVFHSFTYAYSLSTLTILNLKYHNSYNSARASAQALFTELRHKKQNHCCVVTAHLVLAFKRLM